ncbi:hypothetical protein A3Q56_04970 [Intoshia linei]|uniref:Uncharacterized protein n=1 Tax=Intoshia linei TaxID=1819745 RepID=A0A177B0Y3_9BILA|nr:hypothetical protein A3Q56_04970 [Intoshia linei]
MTNKYEKISDTCENLVQSTNQLNQPEEQVINVEDYQTVCYQPTISPSLHESEVNTVRESKNISQSDYSFVQSKPNESLSYDSNRFVESYVYGPSEYIRQNAYRENLAYSDDEYYDAESIDLSRPDYSCMDMESSNNKYVDHRYEKSDSGYTKRSYYTPKKAYDYVSSNYTSNMNLSNTSRQRGYSNYDDCSEISYDSEYKNNFDQRVIIKKSKESSIILLIFFCFLAFMLNVIIGGFAIAFIIKSSNAIDSRTKKRCKQTARILCMSSLIVTLVVIAINLPLLVHYWNLKNGIYASVTPKFHEFYILERDYSWNIF